MSIKLSGRKVTSTNFSNAIGFFIDEAAKEPIIITKHNRAVRVLIDIDEYERLKAFDTREYLHPTELTDNHVEDLKTAKMDNRK